VITLAIEGFKVLEIGLTQEQIINAVLRMKMRARQEFIEDLLAATSPDYLRSIREARSDRKAGRVKTMREIFDE
jgi:hypothetical protein